MSAHRGWWSPAPTTKRNMRFDSPPSSPLPPSPLPSQSSPLLPPQHLWPHHAIQGNSSPSLTTLATLNNSPCSPEHQPTTPSPEVRPYYTGIFLSGPSKHRVLSCYPPRHATVYAHHVTLHYFGYEEGDVATTIEKCLTTTSFPLGSTVAISVVGSAANDRCQALEVTLPRWISAAKNTTVPPHVTVSIVENGTAKEAGILIEERKKEGKIEPVHGLRVLHGIVGVCLTDRRVVYSEEELREAVHFNSGSGGRETEFEPAPPPQPSARLLSLEHRKSTFTSTSTTTSAVDLVSLLHQCFPSTAATAGAAAAPIVPSADEVEEIEDEDEIEVAHHSHQQSINTPEDTTIDRNKNNRETETTTTISEAETERATMHAHHTAYKTALSTSKKAKSAGNHASARAHANIARRHAVAFQRARQRSSLAAFHAHNASILNTFTLDLHGMHVREAVNMLKRYVEGLGSLGHPGGVLLKVVTGFGQHSAIPGRAKVLPAVVEYLAETGVLFDLEEENPGMVRVLLEP